MILKRNKLLYSILLDVFFCFHIFSMERPEASKFQNPIIIFNNSEYDLEIKFKKLGDIKRGGTLFEQIVTKFNPKEEKPLIVGSKQVTIDDIWQNLEISASSRLGEVFQKINVNQLQEFAKTNPSKPIVINISVEHGWGGFVPKNIVATFSFEEKIEEGWEEVSGKEEAMETGGFIELPGEKESLEMLKEQLKYDKPEHWQAVSKQGIENTAWWLGSYTWIKLDEATGVYYEQEGDTCRKILENINKAKVSKDESTLKKIAGNYKIHLMPKIKDLDEISMILARAIHEDKNLAQVIDYFKILNPKKVVEQEIDIKEGKLRTEDILPRIVIYAANGKENAQMTLNKIINLFKAREGANITPRFNQKVTSLIYFAQGNADCKSLPEFREYFEQPSMIYYNGQFTGKFQDHHLKF